MKNDQNTAVEAKLVLKSGITSVSGPDAGTFLQLLISSDIKDMAQGESKKSLLLNPTGKTVAAFWAHLHSENEYLLISELSVQDDLISDLKKLCLRTDAKIQDVSEDFSVVVSSSDHTLSPQDLLIENNHLGIAEIALGVSKTESPIARDRELYETLRIKNGAVNFASDLGQDSIAQEAALDQSAVSFDKGCFLGQELVCRIDSRGASTPNSYFQVVFDSDEILESGLEIVLNGLKIGEITSLAKEGSNVFAIARISRKGAKEVKELNDFAGLKVQMPGQEIDIKEMFPVKGHFSC